MDNLNFINKLCINGSKTMYTPLGNVKKLCAGHIKILIDLFDKMILNTLTTVKYGVPLFPAMNYYPAISYQKNKIITL